mmetsp:Transcript_102074/g.288264  ORF Transcript_102074/g.288264 Transcript_102074/m.288264 type:complete len:208 (+) Transcript_102074:538-1161(+)
MAGTSLREEPDARCALTMSHLSASCAASIVSAPLPRPRPLAATKIRFTSQRSAAGTDKFSPPQPARGQLTILLKVTGWLPTSTSPPTVKDRSVETSTRSASHAISSIKQFLSSWIVPPGGAPVWMSTAAGSTLPPSMIPIESSCSLSDSISHRVRSTSSVSKSASLRFCSYKSRSEGAAERTRTPPSLFTMSRFLIATQGARLPRLV